METVAPFALEPYDYADARAIAGALELSEPAAIVLVRRGHRTPEAAREFLDSAESHDPLAFDSMVEIAESLAAAAQAGKRITVHGDYDVDGVCSTAILVRALREAGASCDWLIPDRSADGYGLTSATVSKLSAAGTEVLVTADCGIGSAAEVAAARQAGIDVIVTDHHRVPDSGPPDCPILHPSLSAYPFEELCATAVAHKLSLALRAAAGLGWAPHDVQLVALATVADMVPLVGENRRYVREGLAEARKNPSEGMRALIAVSHTDAARLDAGDLGFRIAPRINASGRLYRADAGVELMLTDDAERAAEIADELDRANFERRKIEREALDAAELALTRLDPGLRDAPGIVLAGDGWHPGVIGIVASRLVERHNKPAVLIGLDGGRGRGSGRGLPGFDLVKALEAGAEHLIRFGGHAGAAGLEITAADVEPFREAFLAHAREQIAPEMLVRREQVDAVVGVGKEGIGLELAEQLERLGPFGSGNPEPRLLVPGARIAGVRAMGETGNHARFEVESGSGRALGVAFNTGAELRALDGHRADLPVRLEIDRWNGAEHPRLVLREALPLAEAPEPADACSTPASPTEWWERFEIELIAPLDAWPGAAARAAVEAARRAGDEREYVDRRRGASLAALVELESSGGSVLALCADAARRRLLADSLADPRRLGGSAATVACSRCADAEIATALEAGRPGGLVVADWGAVTRSPAALARFEHVVLIEPPPFEHLETLAGAAYNGGELGVTPLRRGFLHLAWGEAELELAQRLLAAEWELRPQIALLYRALAPKQELAGEELAGMLAGEGRFPRSPELAARCVRVLSEVGIAEWAPETSGGSLRVVSSEVTDLERSEAYRAYRARLEEGQRFLTRTRQSKSLQAAA